MNKEGNSQFLNLEPTMNPGIHQLDFSISVPRARDEFSRQPLRVDTPEQYRYFLTLLRTRDIASRVSSGQQVFYEWLEFEREAAEVLADMNIRFLDAFRITELGIDSDSLGRDRLERAVQRLCYDIASWHLEHTPYWPSIKERREQYVEIEASQLAVEQLKEAEMDELFRDLKPVTPEQREAHRRFNREMLDEFNDKETNSSGADSV